MTTAGFTPSVPPFLTLELHDLHQKQPTPWSVAFIERKGSSALSHSFPAPKLLVWANMALRKLLMKPQMPRLARKKPSYSTAGMRRMVNAPEHTIGHCTSCSHEKLACIHHCATSRQREMACGSGDITSNRRKWVQIWIEKKISVYSPFNH